jgi:hypothetical protein
MTKPCSALIVLLVATGAACDKANTAEPHAVADTSAAAPAKPAAGQPASSTAANSVTADGQPVNATGAATLEFQKRIQEYMKIHNEAEAKVPNLKKTDDPVEISKREQALGQMIMTLRANAQTNEIFAKEYQPYFVKIVQDDFAKRSAADRKALVHELPRNIKVDVNTLYPTTLPLITFPAALLNKLPDLPPELEYRIVGRHLILRDVKANLIVDVLRDVVPTIPT